MLPLLVLAACLDSLQSVMPTRGRGKLDEKTVIAGLKEALRIGTQNAVDIVSKVNGYYKNPRITIPLPQELQDVSDVLKKLGLKKKVEEFIQTMNRAAEEAAPKAVDIFVDAIADMSIQDAMGILRGKDNEATLYFERKTRGRLYNIFKPIVRRVLNDVGVTRIYKFIIDTYNSVPGTPRVDFDLEDYVTNKALDGLFTMIADEEKKIRKDPAARVTELLRKVFGS
ncbi:MAG TPA: DUF4197 domain-containing protein [Spirochaetia bacterium]|nr:DUF4197 domain-containing protein [Spirochaetia bacterium]